jgi:hypothetical protein
VGLIARAIEALGIPTISLTSCRDITAKVKPPRACFLDYPLGNNAGIPHDAANQRAIVRAVLEVAPRATQPGGLVDLPFQWPEPGWERQVEDAYAAEAHVLVAQRRRTNYDAAGNFIAPAQAAEAATFCQDCAI